MVGQSRLLGAPHRSRVDMVGEEDMPVAGVTRVLGEAMALVIQRQ